MSSRRFFDKPFDEGTVTKLEIFELYAREWLPVFLFQPNPIKAKIHLFDFFAGPGMDSKGQFGLSLSSDSLTARDAKNFALMIEAACDDFETLDRLIQGGFEIVSKAGRNAATNQPAWALDLQAKALLHRAQANVKMALAKSFISHVARAKRICEGPTQFLSHVSTERKLFLRHLNSFRCAELRDVNEHGIDAGNPKSQRSYSALPIVRP
jgi:hypothetical protein